MLFKIFDKRINKEYYDTASMLAKEILNGKF